MTESSFFQRRVNQIFLNMDPRHHQARFDPCRWGMPSIAAISRTLYPSR